MLLPLQLTVLEAGAQGVLIRLRVVHQHVAHELWDSATRIVNELCATELYNAQAGAWEGL